MYPRNRSVVALALSVSVVALLSSRPSFAQSPSHIYNLNGSYVDLLGGPALTPGTSLIGATGATFQADPGLALSNGFSNTATYSIEMYFRLDATSGFRRLLDFKNRASDTGFYNLDTAFNFYNEVTGPVSAFSNGTMAHVVFTRDGATNTVSAYLNGNTTPQISFIDSGGLATLTGPNNIVYFFTDDTSFPGESSSGFVDYIRTYNTALTANQVNAVYNANVVGSAAPEPSSLALLPMALPLLGALAWRRGKRRN